MGSAGGVLNNWSTQFIRIQVGVGWSWTVVLACGSAFSLRWARQRLDALVPFGGTSGKEGGSRSNENNN